MLARRRWYHYNLTRHAAEALLLSNGKDGSYLLRKSNEREDLYSLSVRGKDSVKHFHIEYTGTSLKFGFNEFSSLKELVLHFANQPLIGSETGTLIVLKHPYPHEVEEPSIYESVRVHTAMQTGRTENDLVPNAPSLGTKEGYLIKQGKIVKNWKTRWFTLHRNELKYFKDQTATEPIRALDLTECSAVQFDYSQERVNCFCLVFPLRTYYLCAKTGIEADEWIKILRWKLVRWCVLLNGSVPCAAVLWYCHDKLSARAHQCCRAQYLHGESVTLASRPTRLEYGMSMKCMSLPTCFTTLGCRLIFRLVTKKQ
uniref:Dual adapter for phosphotyrosine and 3-phosphotyrosine and 3-phosphoinositide n=1 Tax=Coturnix japonica TaxID=93934 RepID=A0A8C2T572_COTJA